MEWTEREEEYLSQIEKQCNDLYYYYAKEHQYYIYTSKRFNIPILVISAVNALTAISLQNFLAQEYVSILNAVLSAGTGILGSIQLYLKLNEKMTNALNSSITFKRIALNISKELSIDSHNRATDGKTFLAEIFAEFTTTLKNGNPLNRKVKNYLKLDKGQDTPTTIESVAEQLIELSNVEIARD
jgi:hypothetical protein